ncbi:MAG: efflux transporter outer membrane subunit [Pseudomonas sp.]|uniref:efflux transporter outer membrane subunit n=1 Tax=Pseudomonas sp. TaxID=306 RepID=UPI003C71E6EA
MAAACLLGSGCQLSPWARNGFKVGPDYRKPAAPVAENWIDSDDPRVISAPPKYPDWWSVFQDPVLNDLVATAHQQNLSLREAGLRVLEARVQRASVAGNLFPQEQQLTSSYAREQIGIVQQPLLAPLPAFRRSFDAWSFGGNLSWEMDIWGKFRRAVEAADASLDASVEEYDALLVCLIAEVVTAYVDIRTFEERLDYARQNVRIQEGSLKLAQTRAEAGKTGDISVHLSESNLEGTRAAIPQLEVGLRQANNRLCTLLGMPPTDLRMMLGTASGIPHAPAEVVLGIPADLLRRRPDVRAAERQVAVQSAKIGIATADFYPSIAINGDVSTQAEQFSDLFSSLSNGGSIGPSFSWNVLNYGRIANNVRFQDARFQELAVNYQNTVLTANQEVEDALVAFLRTQEQVRSLARSAQATQRALELQILNFKEGETDFTGVFVLQGDLVQKQDQLAAAQGEVATSLTSVYKALGGGWQIRCPGFQLRGMTECEPEAEPEGESEVIPLPLLTTEVSQPDSITDEAN